MESQLRLAFLGMGGLAMVVALLGLRTTTSLSAHIEELGHNRLPSVDGLWKVNEGQTQVQGPGRAQHQAEQGRQAVGQQDQDEQGQG